jgi:nucleotide-binding universal stress UspA family protein
MEKRNNKKVSSKETAQICNVFVVGVDGSEGSNNAVELVMKDFLRRGLDKLILVHVSNIKKEQEKGVQYHSKTIYNKYHELLQQNLQEADYEIIFEDRKENENVFEQINEIAVTKGATLLVLGFRGYKGTKNRPDELSKSVTYLVHKPKIPVLVVKEKTSRGFRIGGQFKWLVCVESAESKSFKALTSMLRYVDAENDTLHGFTVDSSDKDATNHPLKKAFDEVMARNEIKNFDFTVVPKEDKADVKSTIIDWIANHLKDENHWIDFIVLGYNPLKYNFNREASNTTVDILKEVNCNVFFDH